MDMDMVMDRYMGIESAYTLGRMESWKKPSQEPPNK